MNCMLAGGKLCFWCRGENATYRVDQKDAQLVLESRDKELLLQAAANRFFEFFIFDFCFQVCNFACCLGYLLHILHLAARLHLLPAVCLRLRSPPWQCQ